MMADEPLAPYVALQMVLGGIGLIVWISPQAYLGWVLTDQHHKRIELVWA
jgi:hypothetical protein